MESDRPVQTTFELPTLNAFWYWRLVYRIRSRGTEQWSMWCQHSRGPVRFRSKKIAERHLRRVREEDAKSCSWRSYEKEFGLQPMMEAR